MCTSTVSANLITRFLKKLYLIKHFEQQKRQTWHLLFLDSMGEFSTTTATDIHTAIFNASYNKYVRPSNITYVGIEFHLLSINDMVSIAFLDDIFGYFCIYSVRFIPYLLV